MQVAGTAFDPDHSLHQLLQAEQKWQCGDHHIAAILPPCRRAGDRAGRDEDGGGAQTDLCRQAHLRPPRRD